MIRIMYQENGEQKDVTGKVIVGHAQAIELKENNMEDRNKTVAELIADLQNQLDRANNRIERLLKENKELKDNNNIQFRNLHDLRLEYNGLYNKFHALDIEHAALVGKYCAYNKAAQDAWNENNKLGSMLKDYQIKYEKEKKKHQRATEKITHLKEEFNVQRDKINYLDDELIAEKVKNKRLKKLIHNDEAMKLIESLQKQLIQKKNEYAELYDELKYDEKLLEISNMNYMIDTINAAKLFIDTYEMLKNDYLKGHITEDIFFDKVDSNVNRVKEIMRTEETINSVKEIIKTGGAK